MAGVFIRAGVFTRINMHRRRKRGGQGGGGGGGGGQAPQ